MASLRFSTGGFPLTGAIVVGYLGFIGTAVGRMTCGWVCPFGFIQDLIHKIPTRKFALWKPLRWGKYAVLGLMVVVMPVFFVDASGLGHPWFCKLICPAGTLEGAIPLLFLKPSLWETVGLFFWNKLAVLILILVAAILISRFFCRVLCPLGAFYSLFSRISLVQLEFVEGNLRGMRRLRPPLSHRGRAQPGIRQPGVHHVPEVRGRLSLQCPGFQHTPPAGQTGQSQARHLPFISPEK